MLMRLIEKKNHKNRLCVVNCEMINQCGELEGNVIKDGLRASR